MNPAAPLVAAVSVLAATAVPSAARAPAYVATTQNVRHTLGPAHARHDLAQAQRGSDVVLTQEMAGRRAARFALPGYGTTQPADMREVAVYWRRSTFTFAGTFPILLHRSHLFSSATRYALAVQLHARAGGCLLVVDVHEIPHVDVAGHPRHLRRLALYAAGMRRLAAVARFARPGCALLVGGDWNVDGNADARVRSPLFPYANLHAAGLRSEWVTFPHAAPTLGRRHVDGFYTDGARALSRRTIAGTYSDHNGDRLTFRITR